jgi:hypothetical protein
MKQYYIYLASILFLAFNFGCGSSPGDNHSPKATSAVESNELLDIADLLTEGTPKADLNLFLKQSTDTENNQSQLQLSNFYNGTDDLPNIAVSNELIKPANRESNFSYTSPLVDDQNLDSVSKSINEYNDLQNEDFAKDATIASLKELNNELLDEIKRLREYSVPKTAEETTTSNPRLKNSEIDHLGKMQGQLQIQKIQINELQTQNKDLEQKILKLTTNPYSKIKLLTPTLLSENKVKQEVAPITLTPARAELQFDAVVTSINGKNKEAFYTEFFILREDLESLLYKSGIELSNYPKIDSYSELWARSRKNPFLYPNIQKKIRTLLLNEVNIANGKRIRTDIDGAGKMPELKTGDYFVIGSAALGKIGVTWNVPINITSGLNKLSLTLANSSWSL